MTALANIHILVVEDELLIALSLEAIFADAGAHVTICGSLSEAFGVAQESFDVAVLDVRLPDGEVFPLAEQLVRRNVPLVFHSGHSDTNRLTERFQGAVALEKPAQERHLLGAVEAQTA